MTAFFRVIRTGFRGFRRNLWLSSATVLMLALSLSVALSILLFGVVVDGVIAELESKVDISVYFKPDASESQIEEVRQTVERFPEVLETRYTSRDDALLRFRERHRENTVIQAALSEIPDNPLEASMAIRATDASAYAAIASFVEGRFGGVISKVNYRENSAIIERIFSVTNAMRLAGLAVGAVLFFVAGLVAFNTIRLAIFSLRDEISVMRLVGASNWFIRGPFLIEGVVSGLLAAALSFGIIAGITRLVREPVIRFVPGVDLFAYATAHWMALLGFAAGIGVIASVLSASVAIRRYLRV